MTSTAIIDPVCGVAVVPDSAVARRDFEGTIYYLCSATCAVKFDTRPRRYTEAANRR